jgi:DNA-binding NarL/FixJ family response regulator
VVLVEARALFAAALKLLLESDGRFAVTTVTADRAGAIAACANHSAELIIVSAVLPPAPRQGTRVDVRPAPSEFLQLCEEMRQKRRRLPVVAILPCDAMIPHCARRLRKASVRCCLDPYSSGRELLDALGAALEGKDRSSKRVLALLAAGRLSGPGGSPRSPRLSSRQVEVALALATGATVKGVAETLCVSPETIRTHRKRLYRKAGVHSARQFMAWLQTLGYSA